MCLELVVECLTDFDDRAAGVRCTDDGRERRIDENHRRAGVAYYVRDLVSGCMRADRRQPHATRQSGQNQLDELGAITHQHRRVRTRSESKCLEQTA